MATIAERFHFGFSVCRQYDDDGKINESFLDFFKGRAKEWAAEMEIECPESFDSTIIFKFKDGSQLALSNPQQAAFCAFTSIIA